MTDPRDPLLERAIEELRRLPEVERAAIDRVTAAAAASRLSAADDDLLTSPTHSRAAWLWVTGAVAAAIIATFVLRSGVRRSDISAASSPVSAPPVRSVTATAADRALPIAQQFVLNDRAAHTVSVVGDFNGWNPKSAPMTRSPGGEWSTIVPVVPGRHTFGYMVDDSIFVLDPRMPKTRDPDLGTDGSIVIVGRP